MSVRVVVSEGESVAVAIRRLKQRVQDGGIYDEMMIHAHFESHRAKRRLKRLLSRQRNWDRVAWQSHELAVDEFAQ
jgi:ribosomal protein S21